MGYSTLAQVQVAAGGEANLIALSDLENTGSVNADVVGAAIDKADGEINRYVGMVRQVPVSEPYPQTLIDLSTEGAVFNLRKGRQMLTQDDRDDNAAWFKKLVDISKGLATLGVEPQPTVSEIVDAAGVVVPLDDDREITPGNLRGLW